MVMKSEVTNAFEALEGLQMENRVKELEFENAELIFKDDAVLEIAKKAINKKTGARGLRSIIESLLLKTMFKLPTMDDVEKVIINQSVVKNVTEPLITYSKNKKISAA